MKMCLGAQLYTVRDYMTNAEDYRRMMAKIAEIGYKTVQMSGYNAQEITPAVIKEVTEANGLRVVLTHNDWERIQREPDVLIEEHNLFNCDAIGIGGYGGDRSYDGFMRFCEDAAPIIEKFKAAGKTFLYHNHHKEFIKYGDKFGLDIICENTDPEGVKLTLDTYWATYAGEDAAAIINVVVGAN